MTSRDELIEAAFKAHEGAPTWQDDPVARDAAIRWHMRGFNDALAVFEKTYTPTDDDRKAMLESIQAGMDYYAREDIPEDGLSEAEQIADFLSDAGFRRAVSPEPQGREAKIHGEFVTMRVDEWRRITDELARLRTMEGQMEEPQGEPSDAPTVQLMARRGGKSQALIDQMLAKADESGVRVEVVDQVIPRHAMLDVWMALYSHETSQAFDAFYEGAEYAEAWLTLLAAIRTRAGEAQGEPTDAQVSAALLGYFPEVEGQPDLQHWGKDTRGRMRAALRAAAAVRGEGR